MNDSKDHKAAAEPPLGCRVRALPGGMRLTVTERCELHDWKDSCVADEVARAVANEREACAKVCEAIAGGERQTKSGKLAARECMAAIRMRSNAEVTSRPPTGD